MRPRANGGNCYNCHQIDKKEISFGTIGPSLYNYGKCAA
jgi:sulfur-oxidizing protein SoxX